MLIKNNQAKDENSSGHQIRRSVKFAQNPISDIKIVSKHEPELHIKLYYTRYDYRRFQKEEDERFDLEGNSSDVEEYEEEEWYFPTSKENGSENFFHSGESDDIVPDTLSVSSDSTYCSTSSSSSSEEDEALSLEIEETSVSSLSSFSSSAISYKTNNSSPTSEVDPVHGSFSVPITPSVSSVSSSTTNTLSVCDSAGFGSFDCQSSEYGSSDDGSFLTASTCTVGSKSKGSRSELSIKTWPLDCPPSNHEVRESSFSSSGNHIAFKRRGSSPCSGSSSPTGRFEHLRLTNKTFNMIEKRTRQRDWTKILKKEKVAAVPAGEPSKIKVAREVAEDIAARASISASVSLIERHAAIVA